MKKALKKIVTIFLVVQFVFSTTGFVLYETFCTCSGKSNLSLFNSSEVCSHKNIRETDCNCCCCQGKIGSETNKKCCNCGLSEIQFVKLDSKVVFGTTYFKLFTQVNTNVIRDLQKERLDELINYENIFLESFEPPPRFQKHNEYLNVICQLKIPAIA